MFFSREAESFLNASGARGAHQKDGERQERSLERDNRFREAGDHLRPRYAEGGDVEEHRRSRRVGRADGDSVESHRRGYRVGRAEGDDVKMAAHKRGKRVYARSHHADMAEVESHSKGHVVRKRHADGDTVLEEHRKGRRVGRADGDTVEAHKRGKRVHRSHDCYGTR